MGKFAQRTGVRVFRDGESEARIERAEEGISKRMSYNSAFRRLIIHS